MTEITATVTQAAEVDDDTDDVMPNLEAQIDALFKQLPKHWVICEQCEGNGRHAKGMGCFSNDDLADLGQDWQDDYFSGLFDRQCECCAGSGKIRQVNYDEALERKPEILAEWQKKADLLNQIDREIDAERDAERRMGC